MDRDRKQLANAALRNVLFIIHEPSSWKLALSQRLHLHHGSRQPWQRARNRAGQRTRKPPRRATDLWHALTPKLEISESLNASFW